MEHRDFLIDTGVLVALYDAGDDYHLPVVDFLAQCTGQAITTTACATEVMWLLNDDWRVQNEFLAHVAQGIYRCEPLMPDDFERIAQRGGDR